MTTAVRRHGSSCPWILTVALVASPLPASFAFGQAPAAPSKATAPAPPTQVERTVEELKDLGVRRLGVSHCTGLSVASRLAAEFGDRFFFNNTGTTIEIS